MPVRLRLALGVLAALAAAFWWISRPDPLSLADLPQHLPDVNNGERVFHAAGCASCHGEPDSDGHSLVRLSGGVELVTAFGTFRAPNISPDPDFGIGGWSRLDFVNAMLRGVAPDGRHYYPAFPYTSYSRMSLHDVLDLQAYLDGLPAVATPSPDHDLRFPYGFRRALGAWKRLWLDASPVRSIDDADPLLARGRYLVEGPGHCGECHTPRNRLGVPQTEAWLSGAPGLDGEGRVPDITAGGLSGWSVGDIAYYLESGIDPDFDVVGGSMVAVQENLARLPAEDRAAIAAYLKHE